LAYLQHYFTNKASASCAHQGLDPAGPSFTHPDLHDELVEEIVPLSSPFSSVCARGSSAFTFLASGRPERRQEHVSALLLARWRRHVARDRLVPPDHQRLLVNASLCTDNATPPMDEPPFLDKDTSVRQDERHLLLTTHQHTTHESHDARRTTHNSQLTTHDS
jgi:hypothetical protein